MNSSGRTSVVIVDDNDLMRMVLRGILRSEEIYEVVGEARNGEAAVDLVKRVKPRIVCMDVEMPLMSGIDALREIKMDCPDVEVVMITGNASQDNVQESIMNGALGFIVKPFNAAKVLKTLNAVRQQLKPLKPEPPAADPASPTDEPAADQ